MPHSNASFSSSVLFQIIFYEFLKFLRKTLNYFFNQQKWVQINNDLNMLKLLLTAGKIEKIPFVTNISASEFQFYAIQVHETFPRKACSTYYTPFRCKQVLPLWPEGSYGSILIIIMAYMPKKKCFKMVFQKNEVKNPTRPYIMLQSQVINFEKIQSRFFLLSTIIITNPKQFNNAH